MNVVDSRKGQKQWKRRVLEESTKEMTKRGSKGPRTKHLLQVHEEARSDRDEGDKETRGPVIPFVQDASAHSRVPRLFMFLSTEWQQTRGSCDRGYSEGTGHGSWSDCRDSVPSCFMPWIPIRVDIIEWNLVVVTC